MIGLLVIDVQNDFVEGGALAVKGGKAVVARINQLIERVGKEAFVVYTMDWHPPNHSQFRAHGGPWPAHCVQGTVGAELVRELHRPGEPGKGHEVLRKGQQPQRDGYSGFEAVNEAGESLGQVLKKRAIDTVFVCGLATDYCVRSTALDAAKAGLRTHVILDATAGVEPETSAKAIAEMEKAGVRLHDSVDAILLSGYTPSPYA